MTVEEIVEALAKAQKIVEWCEQEDWSCIPNRLRAIKTYDIEDSYKVISHLGNYFLNNYHLDDEI